MRCCKKEDDDDDDLYFHLWFMNNTSASNIPTREPPSTDLLPNNEFLRFLFLNIKYN